MSKTYVIVHGAWLDSSCWSEVSDIMKRTENNVLAIDLPGHGKNKAPIEEQDMETYTDYIVSVLNSLDNPAILVGHSMAGMSITQAACRIPEKVCKLVYVTAFLPKDGQSNDGLENGIKSIDWIAMAEKGIGVILNKEKTVSWLKDDFAVAKLYNDVDPDKIPEYLALQGPEAIKSQYQAVHLNDSLNSIPKAFVQCMKDTIISPELQEKMFTDTPCEEVYKIDAGHCPYYSKPEELAEILLKL